MQQKAAATARLTVDGKLTVSSATADIGTGTYTVMTQIAAEMLGLPLEDVTFKLGDSSLPEAPVEGGSFTVASVGSAVKAACEAVAEDALRARPEDRGLAARRGVARRRGVRGRARSACGTTRRGRSPSPRRCGPAGSTSSRRRRPPAPEQDGYSRHTHSAIFAEVEVDEDFGTVRVTRVVTAIAGGRIINPKTARSQVMGGIVWGIGSALHEESVLDHRFGRFMTHNLADYHVPVNADVARHRGDLRRGARRAGQPARREGPRRDRRRGRGRRHRQRRLPRDRQADPRAADHPRQAPVTRGSLLVAERPMLKSDSGHAAILCGEPSN